MTKEEFAKSLNCEVEDLDLILLAKKGDYESVFYDYVSFEKSYEDEQIDSEILTFKEFLKEFKKGYGKSQVLQIARLIELDDGIYYDNEFCF